MGMIVRVQKKGSGLYVCIPKMFGAIMNFRRGTYVLLHSINDRQLMLTIVDDDLPVIEVEKEEG